MEAIMQFKNTKTSDFKFQVLVGILLLAVLFMTSACAVEFEDPDKNQPNPAMVQTAAQAKIAQARKENFGPFSPMPEPNRYTYQDSQGRPIQVQGGETVRFMNQKGEITEATAPRDLVISDVTLAPQDKPVWEIKTNGRIFLERNAILRFGNRRLLLSASVIVSDGALLQSFEKGTKAETGRPGLNSGDVYVSTAELIGTLSIEALGQAGGDGRPGQALPRAEQGVSYPKSAVNCREAKVGGAGKDGRKGNDGETGYRGGAGGQVIITGLADRKEGLHVTVTGGAPGLGGEGGAGQQGGLGGESSYMSMFHSLRRDLELTSRFSSPDFPGLPPASPCRGIAERGAEGKTGPWGNQGEVGEFGSEGSVLYR